MENAIGKNGGLPTSRGSKWARGLLLTALGLTAFVPTARAHERDRDKDSVTRWETIVGLITAPGVNNPVGNINSGAGPWSVSSGNARVNLTNGATSFDVDGLVLNGSASSGTPDNITAVVGTLVCNPGATQVAIDTHAVPLNAQGNADFHGQIGPIPSPCVNPIFLIRIAAPAGAAGRWIATGAVRITGGHDHHD